jgi:hexosaminidase
MKYRHLLFMLLVTCNALAGANDSTDRYPIIPRPASLQAGEGWFTIEAGQATIIVTPVTNRAGRQLRALIEERFGFRLAVISGTGAAATAGAITLTTENAPESLGDEGYLLEVSTTGALIRARSAAGAFYGVQTLRQILYDAGGGKELLRIPVVAIEDKPRFAWRGLHLDVGRHVFPVAFIKRYLDLMALHKLNHFHWHLTEDQGWRLEIKKYPLLAEISAWRSSSPIPANRRQSDGRPYGGFYTQDEVREIVAYAAERHITVVPEIEMPGHTEAVLAAYPELGCTGGPYEVATTWGIKKEVFCAGNDAVFTFLENVLLEVMELFPSKMIHIGGDECLKDRWKECPKCQARIKAEGLKDEHELQSYFIHRMEAFLNKHGRMIIGWDEILEGGLAPNATVMSWRGVQGGIEAARLGHNVIMTPNTALYFDYYQSRDRDNEPPAIGGYLPLETVYGYDPVPEDFTAEQAAYILGAQGNVWTEYINSTKGVEYMAFPRATALAEVVWSPPVARDYTHFMARLRSFTRILDAMQVNYRDPFREYEE